MHPIPICSWAAYGGVTWAALIALGQSLERALEALVGAGAKEIGRVAVALEDMAEAVMGKAGEDDGGEEGQRDEGLARLVAAYVQLFGLAQGDAEVRGGGVSVCVACDAMITFHAMITFQEKHRLRPSKAISVTTLQTGLARCRPRRRPPPPPAARAQVSEIHVVSMRSLGRLKEEHAGLFHRALFL